MVHRSLVGLALVGVVVATSCGGGGDAPTVATSVPATTTATVTTTATTIPAATTTVPAATTMPRLAVGTGATLVAGLSHTCALLTDGTVRCWGANWRSELGQPASPGSPTPGAVDGVTDAVALAAGDDSTVALLADGTVRLWGRGTATPSRMPRLEAAVAIDASCAVLRDGTVRCWDEGFPEEVPGWRDVVAVSHPCALDAAGSVWCRSRDRDTGDWLEPTRVAGVSGARAISGQCALLAGGTVRCWDDDLAVFASTGPGDVTSLAGSSSQTCSTSASMGVFCWGRGDAPPAPMPVPPGMPTTWWQREPDAIAVAVGSSHWCVLHPDGSVRCWGDNFFGQVGGPVAGYVATPLPVWGLTGVRTADVGGYHHACAVLQDGTVWCWGDLDGAEPRPPGGPVNVFGLGDAIAVATGSAHDCAITGIGSVWCWGDNNSGQLGNGTTTRADFPVRVPGLDDAIDVTAGSSWTCAVRRTGGALCWGDNDGGQLGNGTTTTSTTPVRVTGITTAVAIDAGSEGHTCALLRDGSARCWGENYSGELGDGTRTSSTAPVEVKGLRTARGVRAGLQHTCAVLTDGTVRCWGDNGAGQLGVGTVAGSTTPARVEGVEHAIGVRAGSWFSCALLGDGTVTCWGQNHGDVPAPVTGIAGATNLRLGGETALVRLADGTLQGWGNNRDLQLGDHRQYGAPTPVAGLDPVALPTR